MTLRITLLGVVFLAAGCKGKAPAEEEKKDKEPVAKTAIDAAAPSPRAASPVDAAPAKASPLDKLKGGMSPAEVEAVLGKPVELTSGGECSGHAFRWEIDGKSHELWFQTCIGGTMPWDALVADKERNGSNVLIKIDERELDCGRIELSFVLEKNKSGGSTFQCMGGEMTWVSQVNPSSSVPVNINAQADLWQALEAEKWWELSEDCAAQPGERKYRLSISQGSKSVSQQCKAGMLKTRWARILQAMRENQPIRR